MSKVESKAQRKEVTGFRLILGYLGVFLMLVGFLTATPLIMVAFYPGEYGAFFPFGVTAGADVVVGLLLFFLFLFKKKPSRFYRHEESQLLTLIWVFAIVSGAMPFFISGVDLRMNFTMSIFESASS